jgi:microsomal epoxide hydrolase
VATHREIEPFRIDVADEAITDLQARIGMARWPEPAPRADWSYGAELEVVRDLATYWADGYDWRAHEARLNEHPQFVVTIDGQRIHFLHVRSPEADARPLILTHGWPGSVSEFVEMIGPLTDPVAYGGDAADAFHVVVPSLPGYGFSGPTTAEGWDIRRAAEAFAALMAMLGYERYGAQGGDWGSMLSRQLALVDPEHVVGVHVNMLIGFPPGRDDDRADVSAHEGVLLARSDAYLADGNGYVGIQSTRPQTLAYSLVDSPVGLLAWITEKFWAWTDHDGDLFEAVSADDLLTNVSIYWFTGTGGSSARLYYESLRSGSVLVPPFVDVPLGVASFPKEILGCRRRWVDDQYDIVHWTEQERGGHFAALEAPDLLVEDIRQFFRALRQAGVNSSADRT